MRVLVIPDVHLKTWMFDQAEGVCRREKPDRIVCLGDLPDDFGYKNDSGAYRKTFDRAIRFEEDHPDMLWCMGNHECSYLWDCPTNATALMAKEAAKKGVLDLYRSIPEGHLAFVHRIDKVLFSHAGISRWFVAEHLGDSALKADPDRVIEKINAMHAEQMWRDDSPIWLRPQKEFGGEYIRMWRPKTFLQIVGHSPIEVIIQEGSVISCDVFSTYRDGKPIGSQQFCLIDTQTGKWRGVKACR